MSSEAMEEQFINMVVERPHLYDKSNAGFKSNEKKNMAWREIGAKFGISGENAQKHFKALREKYIRSKKEKEKYERSGAGAFYQSKWHLFEMMRFLDDVVKPRKTTSNTLPASPLLILEGATSQTFEALQISNISLQSQIEVESTISQEELFVEDTVLPVSNSSSSHSSERSEIVANDAHTVAKPSTSAPAYQTPTTRKGKEGQRLTTPGSTNKKPKLDEKFSSTPDVLAHSFQMEMPSDSYIHAFCAHLEQEMIKMPEHIMEQFKDDVTEILLQKRREMRLSN